MAATPSPRRAPRLGDLAPTTDRPTSLGRPPGVDGAAGALGLDPRARAIERRRREAARRRRRARIRRNRLIAACLALGGLALILSFTLGSSPLGLVRSAPTRPRLVSLTAERLVAPGHLGAIAWPTKGEGAIALLGSGVMAASPSEAVVPIASLTKMMTALVVLRDHPLAPGAEGPTFTMTPADVAAWVRASQTGESNVSVASGERLTEHQLLEALLIPSADNIADYLARFDAGSIPAFVSKMNAAARRLGLRHTVYADASGVNPGSRSTAADQALVAASLMTNPVVRGIVAKPSLPFPVNGTIWNYNPALGTDGIVGVKSGFTSKAQSCLVTAAWRRVNSHDALVVSVALGQPDGLGGAARVDRGLLDRATKSLFVWRPPASAAIAEEMVGAQAEPVGPAGKLPSVLAWPGMRLRPVVVPVRFGAGVTPSVGETVGRLELESTTHDVVASVPLVALGAPGSGTSALLASRSGAARLGSASMPAGG